MEDRRSRPPPKHRKNDPLGSPLVKQTRLLVEKVLAKYVDVHLDTHSTETALVTGGYVAGMADALKLLEWVAVELAKRPSL